MQFRDFLVVLRARWRTIAACALIVLGATAAYTLTLTPSYTATSRVYFSATSPDVGAAQARGVYVITSTDLNTYIEVLRSPAVIDPLRTEGADALHRLAGTGDQCHPRATLVPRCRGEQPDLDSAPRDGSLALAPGVDDSTVRDTQHTHSGLLRGGRLPESVGEEPRAPLLW